MRKCTKLWKQRDGSKIRVCDMTDAHLLHSIALMKRAYEIAIGRFVEFAVTLSGEAAVDHAGSTIEQMEEDGPSFMFPLYDDLVGEADRRGLGSGV